jgi:DNA-directed RNA polymerase specialized sigma24 family protein
VSVPSNLRSDDDFEDFYQASYPAYDAPEAWVRRVALNLATTGLRRARRFATAKSWSCTMARTCRWSRSPNSSGCPPGR